MKEYPYIGTFRNTVTDTDDEFCEAEQITAELLKRELCFVNYLKHQVSLEYHLTVILLCNDLFYWGMADCEAISSEEDLISIWKHHCDDPEYGTLKWCCKRRNMKPQKPYIKLMKDAGLWTDEMEALPVNDGN